MGNRKSWSIRDTVTGYWLSNISAGQSGKKLHTWSSKFGERIKFLDRAAAKAAMAVLTEIYESATRFITEDE